MLAASRVKLSSLPKYSVIKKLGSTRNIIEFHGNTFNREKAEEVLKLIHSEPKQQKDLDNARYGYESRPQRRIRLHNARVYHSAYNHLKKAVDYVQLREEYDRVRGARRKPFNY